ncbi:MAG TPA: OPT/YSL family transporter, partial [Myxococcales bacterium]
GCFLAITVELCGVSPLSFAVGAYLPLSTTLPIFVGGAIKGIVDRTSRTPAGHGDDLGPGSLFATGLVAGGALAGVLVALLSVNDNILAGLNKVDASGALSRALGEGGYMILGVIFFSAMGLVLFRVAKRPFTSPAAGAGKR